jgi:cytochrome P450
VLTAVLRVTGSEATSVTFRISLLVLLTSPEAYRKAQAETAAFNARKTANSDSVISFADAKTLPYIQAVIREAIRL